MFWIVLELSISKMGLIMKLSPQVKNKPRLKMTESGNLATMVPTDKRARTEFSHNRTLSQYIHCESGFSSFVFLFPPFVTIPSFFGVKKLKCTESKHLKKKVVLVRCGSKGFDPIRLQKLRIAHLYRVPIKNCP